MTLKWDYETHFIYLTHNSKNNLTGGKYINRKINNKNAKYGSTLYKVGLLQYSMST